MQRHSRHCPPVSCGMGTGRHEGGVTGSVLQKSISLILPIAWASVCCRSWTCSKAARSQQGLEGRKCKAATSCGGRVPVRPESSDGVLFASCLCLSCRGQPGIATCQPRDARVPTLEIEAGQGYWRPSRWDLVVATQQRGAPVPVFTKGLGPRSRG